MKTIFTLLFPVLFFFPGGTCYASAFKKTKSPDQQKSAVISQNLLKNVTLADQPDSAAFYMWDQNAWRLYYTSSYMYEGSLQVQNTSYYYNDDGMTVDYVSRTNSTYDGMDRLSREVMQNLEGDEFVNANQTVYSYYNNTNMTTLILTEIWDNGGWVASSRQKSNYDEKGNQTSDLWEIGYEGIWFIQYGDSTEYEYDGNKIILQTHLWYEVFMFGIEGSWVPEYRTAFTWTGDIATSGIESEYENEQWVEKEKYVDVEWNNPGGFDLEGEPSHYKIQVMKSGEWTDSLLVNSTYDGNIQTRTEQIWKDGGWVNDYQEVFDFENIDDEDFMFAEYYAYDWIGDPADWVLTEGWRMIDDYEKSALEGRLISTIMQSYDLSISDQWENVTKIEYFYDTATDVETLILEIGISVYPNPSDGVLNLKFGQGADRVEIAIVNSTGTVIFSDQIDKPTKGFIYSKDLQQFDKGLYFIRIQAGDRSGTLKFILR